MKENSGKIPCYMQIQQYVLQKVKSGEYQIGDRIPAESELAEQFGVSRVTANKAIKELSLTGILQRTKGRGTYVVSQEEVQPTLPVMDQMFSASVKINELGFRSHQLLQFRILNRLRPELAQMLDVEGEEGVYEVVLSNESMDSIDVIYLPLSLISDIVPTLEDLRSRSAFDYIKTYSPRLPKYMKIFINPMEDDFFSMGRQYLGQEKSLGCWSAGIYDGEKKFIGATFTIYSNADQNIPLFMLSF